MILGTRLIKRFLVAFIGVGILLAAILFGVRFFHEPVTVTPTPDPRDSLKPLQVLSTNIFEVEPGDYDILLRIANPNQDYGSGDVRYTIRSGNKQLTSGSWYILPGQTKYLVISPIRVDYPLTDVTFSITSINWQELDTLALQGVNFVVTNSTLSKDRLRGFVNNNSDFDISRVDVAVVLFDVNEKPLAVNRTEIHTFLAKTTRGFEASWPVAVPNTIKRTYIEANANLFQQSSFIRTYGGQELFQTY